MTASRREGGEVFIAPLYFVAFLLIATPLADFVTSILPLRFGEIEWRFASVGLLSGFLLTPLLGVAVAMVVAHYADHQRFQRVLAVLNLLVAIAFVVLFLAFLLDIFQLRAAVQEEALEAFKGAATKAVIKHISFVVAIGWLAWTGFRVSRWTVPVAKRQPASVVIG